MPQCTKCYREFCKKKNLLRHMRTVHGEPQKEEHRCNCGKTFGRKDNLSKHKKNCKQAIGIFTKFVTWFFVEIILSTDANDVKLCQMMYITFP